MEMSNANHTDYYQNYINEKIIKYGKSKIIESGIVLLENEREIKTLSNLVTQFCCLTECKNCPVHIHQYETRNDDEKEYTPCYSNLYNWVINEAKKVEEV